MNAQIASAFILLSLGASLASAFFTVFFEIPNCLAIARIGTCSERCNRRTSAQSSTLNTP